MRRKDREITQPEELLAILERCDVCHLALHGGTFPYVVPLNFGVTREGEGVALWFHGAAAGKKLELLEENHHAAFSAACPGALIRGPRGCDYSMAYESVCGTGMLTRVSGEEVRRGLEAVMEHYAPGGGPWDFDSRWLSACAVLKLTVEEMTGKRKEG